MTTLPPMLPWKPKEVVWWCWFQGFEKESSQLVLVPNCKWGWFKYKSLSATNLSIYLQKSKKYYVQLHCSKRAKINSTTLFNWGDSHPIYTSMFWSRLSGTSSFACSCARLPTLLTHVTDLRTHVIIGMQIAGTKVGVWKPIQSCRLLRKSIFPLAEWR